MHVHNPNTNSGGGGQRNGFKRPAWPPQKGLRYYPQQEKS